MMSLNAIAFLLVNLLIHTIFASPVFAQTSITISTFNPQGLFLNTLQWIESLGYVGGIIFILIYILATIAFIPGSALTLGAGTLFGVIWGSLYVFIGATLGAIIAFLIGRYLARDWISKKIQDNEKFAAIDRAVTHAGFKIVLLTRLSPAFPFNLLNYAFGVTGVRLKEYAIASIGMIPGTVMYVYIGSFAGELGRIGSDSQSPDPTLKWAIRIIGLIATVLVTLYMTNISRKAIKDLV
ncbi:MAG TPA: TVP38/TMEM64 family protein [Pseudanabaena sp.]|nr:TVP38/TMEM64 family protein [Pseudanabaena sp.]